MFSVTIRERSGQVYTFHFDKPEILIGRVKGNDVILPKQNISKRHALIRSEGSTFVVEDFGSTNGTFVNGHRITDPVEIGSEDKVYLGDFVMQFFAIDAENRVEVAESPRALDAVPEDAAASEDLKALIEGVSLTERELLNAMERHGIRKVDPKGEKFDHNLHQAMFEADTPGVEPGTVIEVAQPGYVIGDRLLRPAMVGVAKKPPAAAAPESGAQLDTKD